MKKIKKKTNINRLIYNHLHKPETSRDGNYGYH